MTIEYLNADEAFKVAMNLERDGLKFYTKVADAVRSPEARRIFKRLEKDEIKHLNRFRRLNERANAQLAMRPISTDQEITAYLRSLIDSGIFKGIKAITERAIEGFSEQEALYVGIQAEKDSILFYEEALKLALDESGKRAFRQILKEERKHLVILTARSQRLKGGE